MFSAQTAPSLTCSFCSHKLLRSPRKPARKISKIPFKVLDAPELQDDFYLNLVDWSAGNLLSVGLGACVYLWSACTSQVTRLCDLSVDGDSVTSVCWNERVRVKRRSRFRVAVLPETNPHDVLTAALVLSGGSGCRWNPQGLRTDLGRRRRQEADHSGGSLGTCWSVLSSGNKSS